ncbi:MAG: ABC transporter substrate-binding protein, partial [Chloroflexota bacterium]
GSSAPATSAAASAAPAASTSGSASPAASSSGAAAGGRELRVIMGANQGTLDPFAVATEQEMLVTRNVYESLMRYKPNTSQLEGDLATSWSVSPDGLEYTFHLRPGVKWQKGYGAFTAADVKASYDYLLDPANKQPFRTVVNMIKSVSVVDPMTVMFTLNAPYVPFLQLMTDYRVGPIVNVKAIRAEGANWIWQPVGTGPYMLQSANPRVDATIVANPDYWGPPPAIKKIYMKTITDDNAAVAAMENKQFDLWDGRANDSTVVKHMASEGFVQTAVNRHVPLVLLMNLTVKPFDNLKVRQAIAYSVNRQQIIDLGLQGDAIPWYNPVPKGYIDVDPNVPHFDTDVNKAKALLSQAGYPNGVAVTLNVYQGPVQQPSNVLQEQLKQSGIKVTQQLLDQPTFIKDVFTNKNIDFALHCCQRQPDPDLILSDMFSAKNRGAIYISHIDLEPQLAQARQELDAQKRQQDYYKLETQIINDADMIPIAMTPSFLTSQPDLKGMPSSESIWGLDWTQYSFK